LDDVGIVLTRISSVHSSFSQPSRYSPASVKEFYTLDDIFHTVGLRERVEIPVMGSVLGMTVEISEAMAEATKAKPLEREAVR